MIGNLDEICPIDSRPIGDHTLREWAEHAEHATIDVPYEAAPAGLPLVDGGPATGAPFADTVDTRAMVGDASHGGLKILLPCLELSFGLGHADRPPDPVTKVTFCGPPAIMRAFGKLVRDSAYGAANAAERAGATG